MARVMRSGPFIYASKAAASLPCRPPKPPLLITTTWVPGAASALTPAIIASRESQTWVGTVEVAMLTIGKSEIGPINAPALSARHLGADGLIGIDALADQRLLLDFDKRTITVQDSRTPFAANGLEIVVTARRRKGQLIITQASIGNRAVSAVIDTGSEVTLGNRALRERLYGTRRPEKMFDIQLLSVTGQVLKLVAANPDAILIAAGVAGFATVLSRLDWLEPALRYGGAGFLFAYALRSAHSAWTGGNSMRAGDTSPEATRLGRCSR